MQQRNWKAPHFHVPAGFVDSLLTARLNDIDAGEENRISESNEKCQQQNKVLVANNMVTQSFAFREPVSDLGQGVFPAPDMLPRKQVAYLLQGESVISPPTPEKPQKRRRNSLFQQIFPPDYQNDYVSQLPNGRLSKGVVTHLSPFFQE